jgi:hypothetical protein
LIEIIRDKIIALKHLKWIMQFGWVKGHAGIEGNKLVDKFAKEAAVEEGPVIYDKIQVTFTLQVKFSGSWVCLTRFCNGFWKEFF